MVVGLIFLSFVLGTLVLSPAGGSALLPPLREGSEEKVAPKPHAVEAEVASDGGVSFSTTGDNGVAFVEKSVQHEKDSLSTLGEGKEKHKQHSKHKHRAHSHAHAHAQVHAKQSTEEDTTEEEPANSEAEDAAAATAAELNPQKFYARPLYQAVLEVENQPRIEEQPGNRHPASGVYDLLMEARHEYVDSLGLMYDQRCVNLAEELAKEGNEGVRRDTMREAVDRAGEISPTFVFGSLRLQGTTFAAELYEEQDCHDAAWELKLSDAMEEVPAEAEVLTRMFMPNWDVLNGALVEEKVPAFFWRMTTKSVNAHYEDAVIMDLSAPTFDKLRPMDPTPHTPIGENKFCACPAVTDDEGKEEYPGPDKKSYSRLWGMMAHELKEIMSNAGINATVHAHPISDDLKIAILKALVSEANKGDQADGNKELKLMDTVFLEMGFDAVDGYATDSDSTDEDVNGDRREAVREAYSVMREFLRSEGKRIVKLPHVNPCENTNSPGVRGIRSIKLWDLVSQVSEVVTSGEDLNMPVQAQATEPCTPATLRMVGGGSSFLQMEGFSERRKKGQRGGSRSPQRAAGGIGETLEGNPEEHSEREPPEGGEESGSTEARPQKAHRKRHRMRKEDLRKEEKRRRRRRREKAQGEGRKRLPEENDDLVEDSHVERGTETHSEVQTPRETEGVTVSSQGTKSQPSLTVPETRSTARRDGQAAFLEKEKDAQTIHESSGTNHVPSLSPNGDRDRTGNAIGSQIHSSSESASSSSSSPPPPSYEEKILHRSSVSLQTAQKVQDANQKGKSETKRTTATKAHAANCKDQAFCVEIFGADVKPSAFWPDCTKEIGTFPGYDESEYATDKVSDACPYTCENAILTPTPSHGSSRENGSGEESVSVSEGEAAGIRGGMERRGRETEGWSGGSSRTDRFGISGQEESSALSASDPGQEGERSSEKSGGGTPQDRKFAVSNGCSGGSGSPSGEDGEASSSSFPGCSAGSERRGLFGTATDTLQRGEEHEPPAPYRPSPPYASKGDRMHIEMNNERVKPPPYEESWSMMMMYWGAGAQYEQLSGDLTSPWEVLVV
uniref:Uncharacterized protein n=1 Tax=Chromera velia CCMP2878 TaxID=1169474 RepID=A0A0G4GF93_9ALVE|eukprot:Cvel_21636.t1-p1 / transcript=Cvel_21636.t1 / gene=Cvel_21636 / organism=Chromera_velia_CCMP2878 / gene_product=hypothetical protein / transcript_product=hypothetical protein / location=Cvel_scaffold2046:4695-26976(-) / protein_length=1069 / sequence_SO=supercontig / SO=protein_coding / is_pseudo=false